MNASHSWTDYQERLGRVIAYVHDHLDEALDLNRLADVAHLSPFHWHRVYHALYGETLAATVRRLRLQRASGYLANTAMPVAPLWLPQRPVVCPRFQGDVWHESVAVPPDGTPYRLSAQLTHGVC